MQSLSVALTYGSETDIEHKNNGKITGIIYDYKRAVAKETEKKQNIIAMTNLIKEFLIESTKNCI